MTLTELRLSVPFSMRELAEESGLTLNTIIRLEHGTVKMPLPSTVRAILKACNKHLAKPVTVADLEF